MSKGSKGRIKAAVEELYLRHAANARALAEWDLTMDGFVLDMKKDRMSSRLKTAWADGARHEHAEGGIPLGTFGDYDLYLCPQDGLPHMLMARFGSGNLYRSFNPKLLGRDRISNEAIAEAFRRAVQLGYGDLVGA